MKQLGILLMWGLLSLFLAQVSFADKATSTHGLGEGGSPCHSVDESTAVKDSALDENGKPKTGTTVKGSGK